jgi:poly-D-alanine transfer protein DltD
MGCVVLPPDTASTSVATSAPRPVGILAALLAVAIAVGVARSGQVYALRLAGRYVQAVAGHPSPVKSATLTMQRAAFASGHMLPVYGSSELYCCGNPYRATQLFASEPTGFGAFALGRAGTGDLFFMETFGALGHVLDGRKVVISSSPTWFDDREGIGGALYAGTFSPEIAYMFLFDAPISLRLLEAGARRMLAYSGTLGEHPLLRMAVRELADPTPLHLAAYFALVPLGQLKAWVEQLRDAAQTRHFILGHPRLRPNQAPQPRSLDWVALAARATRIAERRDTSNPFGFPNWTYRHLLHRGDIGSALALYRSGASNRDGQLYPAPSAWEASMSDSAEWTDLRLGLAVLRELGAQPLVWTIPMPGFYDDYTALSAPARQAYYEQWERVVEQAGVPWLDFGAADEDRYFLSSIFPHLSPRGWIFADRAIDMFWHGQPIDEIRGALRTLAEQVPSPPAPLGWQAEDRARRAVLRSHRGNGVP